MPFIFSLLLNISFQPIRFKQLKRLRSHSDMYKIKWLSQINCMFPSLRFRHTNSNWIKNRNCDNSLEIDSCVLFLSSVSINNLVVLGLFLYVQVKLFCILFLVGLCDTIALFINWKSRVTITKEREREREKKKKIMLRPRESSWQDMKWFEKKNSICHCRRKKKKKI